MKNYLRRMREESSLLRTYLWKYRKLAFSGLAALLVVDALEVVPPLLLKEAVDVSLSDAPKTYLLWVALTYLGVGAIQACGRYAWRMWLIRASMLAGRDMRSLYAHHLFSLSMSFFDRKRIGDLMSHATSDVEAVRMMLGAGLLTLADAIFYLIMVPIAMFSLSPPLALLSFLPLPIIPWVVFKLEKKIHDRYEEVQETFGELSSQVQESLNGVRVTKAFAREPVQIARMRAMGIHYSNKNLARAWVQVPFGPILDFVMSLGMVLLLFVGGRILIGMSGNPGAPFTLAGFEISPITLGTFVAFQRYTQKMVWPMAAFGMAISSYQRAVSSSGRLKDIFAEKSDVENPDAPAVAAAQAMRGEIEFRKLTFAFPQKPNEPVLRDISLKIGAGERVAFVGAIGAGKSALLSLLTRLYPVNRGMLFIDGRDINDWDLAELRRQIGYVSQDVFLFSDSVVENLAYGAESNQELIARAKNKVPFVVEEAAKLSAVHDDLVGLVDAYETRLGERGVNLSGGQKQRVSIARALVKKPAILVLDDALSSVDVHTEEKILAGLRARPGRNTEVIAAHRISTVKDADRIVVLDGGCVRQLGTHAELIQERRGAYRRFYDQQQLREELDALSEKEVEADSRV